MSENPFLKKEIEEHKKNLDTVHAIINRLHTVIENDKLKVEDLIKYLDQSKISDTITSKKVLEVESDVIDFMMKYAPRNIEECNPIA